jgi:mannose-6-phosphate isomerase-like protein (cupin superfamily)
VTGNEGVFTIDVKTQPKVLAPDSTIIQELLNPNSSGMKTMVKYSLAHGTIPKGKKTLKHRLRTTSEVYFILAGKARFTVDEDVVEVEPESLVYIPPHATQNVENIGNSNLRYLVICDPAWSSKDVEIQ